MKPVQGSLDHSDDFLFTILLSLSLLLLLLYKIFNRRSRRLTNLPPSPPKLPSIGNLHQIGKLPHRSLRALAQKYGPLMQVHFGGTPTLVVSSADAAREVMKTRDAVFSNRRKTTAVEVYFGDGKDVAFAPYGGYWKQAKKICVVELLNLKRVQSFQFIRDEEAEIVMDKIREACAGGGDPVNLTKMLNAVASNIISRCVLGQKIEEEGGRSKYGELIREALNQFGGVSIGDMFSSLQWLDYLTGFILQLKSTSQALYALLDHVVEEHKISASVDDPLGKKDFADILLQVQKNGALDLPLTQDEIKAILLDVIIAGADTNAATMQ